MAKKKPAPAQKTKKTATKKTKGSAVAARPVIAEIVDSPSPMTPTTSLGGLPPELEELGLEEEGFEPPEIAESDESDEIAPSDNKLPVLSGERAVGANDPVSIYLAELRKYPLLTPEQEREIAIRYRETGDPKAAEMLVTSNLRFVVKVAAEYSKFGARLIDLIQEGNVGLMQAVKEFNPYRGVRVITYAVWWIRGYIQEYLMRQYSMVRIGTTQNQRKLFYQLQKQREQLEALGQQPDYALLSSRLGIPEHEIETMQQRLSGRDVSLNQPLDDESQSSLMDFQTDSSAQGVDDELGHQEELSLLRDRLDKIRDQLSEKELYILDHRLLADEPMTLQEIGEKYGTTREAVRQLEQRLMNKIKKSYESE